MIFDQYASLKLKDGHRPYDVKGMDVETVGENEGKTVAPSPRESDGGKPTPESNLSSFRFKKVASLLFLYR